MFPVQCSYHRLLPRLNLFICKFFWQAIDCVTDCFAVKHVLE